MGAARWGRSRRGDKGSVDIRSSKRSARGVDKRPGKEKWVKALSAESTVVNETNIAVEIGEMLGGPKQWVGHRE